MGSQTFGPVAQHLEQRLYTAAGIHAQAGSTVTAITTNMSHAPLLSGPAVTTRVIAKVGSRLYHSGFRASKVSNQ